MRQRWDQLPEPTRRLIVFAGAAEAALKLAALVDIARRPTEQIRGSKLRWAGVVIVVNSFGAVPLAYFAFGRRSPSDAE